MPDANGSLKFSPGAILANFSKVTIIDEFNRADIDKAFGPLFSILSGQPVILPYRADPSDPDNSLVEILPLPAETLASYQWAPTANRRLICTLNTYDKASLFQMSYALARRFAWVHLDVPRDLPAFVEEYAARQGWEPHPLTVAAEEQGEAPISRVWAAINEVRPLGPAPIIDVIETTRILTSSPVDDESEAIEWRVVFLHVLAMFVVPLMDGIEQQQAHTLAEQIQDILNPGPGDQPLRDAVQALRSQMVLQSV
jgi:5-methylcytosine-specific restriction protein B